MQHIEDLAQQWISTRLESDFSLLYSELRDVMQKWSHRYIINNEEKLDIIDETISRVYINIDIYNTEYRFMTWVFTILKNEYSKYLYRKNKYMIQEIGDYAYKEIDKERILKEEEILLYFENIKEPFREIFIDRITNKTPYHELAIKYNIPINTVRTRIFQAKKILIKKFQIKN